MTQGTYGQFCPVAMAAEVLCTRWTVVLLRELVAGSTRFNDLRRGVPRMSPALLSRRLKELEAAGVVQRAPSATEPGVHEYHLTEAGRALEPVIGAFGAWGQRWVGADLSLQHLDVGLLMWDMRRHLDPNPLPKRRSVIQFQYPALPAAQRIWWLLVSPRVRRRPVRLDRPPDHDGDLDGRRHGATRAPEPAPAADRRPRAGRQHADLARPQPVRPRARGGSRASARKLKRLRDTTPPTASLRMQRASWIRRS
jgi:DNA-binding HxlR family transcriptional regulator